ncbi:unnamed protein product, partial [Rotaria sordida]
ERTTCPADYPARDCDDDHCNTYCGGNGAGCTGICSGSRTPTTNTLRCTCSAPPSG